MFIYFLALSRVCYMHPMCRWEEFSFVIFEPPRRFLHLNACFCSILLMTVKTKPHNIEIRSEIHSHNTDPKMTLTCNNASSG